MRKAVKTGEILIALVTTTQNPEITKEQGVVMQEWKNMLLNLPLKGKIAGILQIDNDSVEDSPSNSKVLGLKVYTISSVTT